MCMFRLHIIQEALVSAFELLQADKLRPVIKAKEIILNFPMLLLILSIILHENTKNLAQKDEVVVVPP